MSFNTIIALPLLIAFTLCNLAPPIMANSRSICTSPVPGNKGDLLSVIDSYWTEGNFGTPEFGNSDIALIYLQSTLLIANSTYKKGLKGIQFNEKPTDDLINIYFFKNDPQECFQDLIDNCTFMGIMNIVICDLHFIKKIQTPPMSLEDLTLEYPDKGSDSERVKKIIIDAWVQWSKDTVLWLLGHEIGHIVHSHGERHFMSVSAKGKLEDTVLSPTFKKEEEEADTFAVDVIKSTQLASRYFQAINAFVTNMGKEILDAQGVKRSFVNGKDPLYLPVRVRDKKFIPPPFYRAVLINKQLCALPELNGPSHCTYYNDIYSRIHFISHDDYKTKFKKD